MLGNDIVDIDFCELPAHCHVRYLDRVCGAEEADSVRRSVDPVRAVAVIWAAKESAFKMLSKEQPSCHFVPRQFATQIENRDPARINEKLSVLYGRTHVQTSIFFFDKWVHAVAAPPGTQVYWTAQRIKRCFFAGCRAVDESQAARFLANSLLATLALGDVSLEFAGRVPYLARKGRSEAEMDVSLSHHGAYAAAAVMLPGGYQVSESWRSARFAPRKSSEAVCSTCTA